MSVYLERPDEADAQAALAALEVMDSSEEPAFDAIVRAASIVCGVPIALISLLDLERQWFKANVGLPGVSESPRSISFCAHTLLGDGWLEISDAAKDGRFLSNPMVLNGPAIRFYAGASITAKNGSAIGTLCVADSTARSLSCEQRETLKALAVVASHALNGRLAGRLLARERERLAVVAEVNGVGVWELNVKTGEARYSFRWAEILGETLETLGTHSLGTWLERTHPSTRDTIESEILSQITNHEGVLEISSRVHHRDGHWRWVIDRGKVTSWDQEGHPEWIVGSRRDDTARREREEQLHRSEKLLERTGQLAGVGGWELDLTTRVPVWTDQVRRIHGVSAEYEPTLEGAVNFYAPEARPLIEAAIANSIATGQSWDLEVPFIRATGEQLTVRAVGQTEYHEGKAVRLLGAFQDVSEVVAQRKALKRALERVELATASGGIGIWEYDVVTHQMSWDASMYQIYGAIASDDTPPLAMMAAQVHPDDRASLDALFAAADRGELEVVDIEHRIALPDGQVGHVRASARLEYNELGERSRMVGVLSDVTPLRRLSAQLAEQHELLRVTLQSIGDAVITTDALGVVTWLNPVAEHLTGWVNRDAVGRPLREVFRIVNDVTRLTTENIVLTCLEQDKVVGLASNTVLISRDGSEFGISDSAAPIRDAGGKLIGVVLVFHDVTEQRRLSGEMNFRASHDALTGLVNRSEFEVRLRRALSASHESDQEHALLYIDLDQFKVVNDTCGHTAGDQLLQEVAKLMSEPVRANDTLARLGGDEFAIILERCTSEQAQRVAQQICAQMDAFRFQFGDRRFRVGASIGLVPVDRRWATTASVMQAADSSCYAAKEAGRNRVHSWFESDTTARARDAQVQWASRLEQALDEDLFVLEAQRIVSVHGEERGLYAEVLIRMAGDDGTLVPPGAFLPAAERFHFSSRIDKWVLTRVVNLLAAQTDLSTIGTLCVNLSGRSVGDKAFHLQAVQLLSGCSRAVCERLCLEITETTAVTNMSDASAFIELIRALGVRVALDDFGAGASSFGYLKSLTVDVIKIDGQFVTGIIGDKLDDAAVRCFVEVAKVVGAKTVAEFVEKPEVLARLKELGVDYVQGFLLHSPEPIDAVLGHSQG